MPEEQGWGVSRELEAWLSHRASQVDRDPEEVLARAVATYRLLSEHDGRFAESGEGPADPVTDRLRSLDARLEAADDRTDGLADRLDDHEATTEENIADLRERVIQVLQTARGKADADHAHESLEGRVDDAAVAVDALGSSLDTVKTELAALDRQVDGGFENFEAILKGLADTVGEADGKLDTLANAVVSLRRRASELEGANARRNAVEDLQTEANRNGVGVADCEHCGGSVDIGLLGEPRCPHCASVLTGVSPGRRFLGRSTLTVGDRPALEGDAFEWTDPDDVFEDDE